MNQAVNLSIVKTLSTCFLAATFTLFPQTLGAVQAAGASPVVIVPKKGWDSEMSDDRLLALLSPKPGGIVLKKGWDSAMSDGVATMKELRDLLSGFAKAAPNTGPAPDIEIYKGIRYLMPLKDAVKTLGLGQEVNSKLMVACPGFPFNSLFGFSFHGNFDGGFDTVYIVTDGARQVVAVEFTNVSVKKTNIVARQSTKGWVTFDFINTRIKGQTDAAVRHSTDQVGKVLKIDSVFVNPTKSNKPGSSEYGAPSYAYEYGVQFMHPTRLYLPQPLAELILYRIGKSGI